MGDAADMLMDYDEGESDDISCYERKRRVIRCRQCGKNPLNWRKILDIWVMFEKSGKVHTCGGYEPPIEVLKELSKEVLAETKEKLQWQNLDKAKKRGGLIKLIPLLPDDQLIDLYTSFIRDSCGDPDVEYKNEMKVLKAEILQRMK